MSLRSRSRSSASKPKPPRRRPTRSMACAVLALAGGGLRYRASLFAARARRYQGSIRVSIAKSAAIGLRRDYNHQYSRSIHIVLTARCHISHHYLPSSGADGDAIESPTSSFARRTQLAGFQAHIRTVVTQICIISRHSVAGSSHWCDLSLRRCDLSRRRYRGWATRRASSRAADHRARMTPTLCMGSG